MRRTTCGVTILFYVSLLWAGRCWAAEGESPMVRVWMYSIYKSNVSRNVVDPFFQQLEARISGRFLVDTNNRPARYLKSCKSGQPAIVLAPFPIAKHFMTACSYEVVGVSHQTFELFVRKDMPDPAPGNVHKLALLKGTHSTLFIPEELAAVNRHFSVVLYPDLFSLVENLKKDGVDAVAFTQDMLTTVKPMENSWKPVMTFRQRGKALALVSTALPPHIKTAFTQLLLEKDGISTAVFVDKMTLGGFEAPTREEQNLFTN